jgi:hypothetical protein
MISAMFSFILIVIIILSLVFCKNNKTETETEKPTTSFENPVYSKNGVNDHLYQDTLPSPSFNTDIIEDDYLEIDDK